MNAFYEHPRDSIRFGDRWHYLANWRMQVQYVDEPLTGRLLDGENGHMDFVSVVDLPYTDLVSAAREANLTLLKSLQ